MLMLGCVSFCLAHLHNGHALARVDLVGCYGVTVEVAHTLDLVCLAVQLDLVGLHDLGMCES